MVIDFYSHLLFKFTFALHGWCLLIKYHDFNSHLLNATNSQHVGAKNWKNILNLGHGQTGGVKPSCVMGQWKLARHLASHHTLTKPKGVTSTCITFHRSVEMSTKVAFWWCHIHIWVSRVGCSAYEIPSYLSFTSMPRSISIKPPMNGRSPAVYGHLAVNNTMMLRKRTNLTCVVFFSLAT